MSEYITDDIENSSNFDREYSDKEISIGKSSNEENFKEEN